MSATGASTIVVEPALTPTADAAAGSRRQSDTRKYLRGSGMLLSGRGVSLTLNLAVQVLTVRYLAKSDYGAFAYALSVASMGTSVVLLGMDKALPRFIPMYQERKAEGRVFGAIALALGAVVGLGLALVVAVLGLRGVLLGTAVNDPLALSLLLVLVALAPIDAIDSLLQALLAVFVGPRAIFWRRHVLAPGLKLAVVLLVIAVAGDVRLLAWGYLAAGAFGVAAFVPVLVRAWRRQGLLRHARPGSIELPARELFDYGAPLLVTELTRLLRGGSAIILLEYLRSTTAVAEYRAVLPIAKLNLIVLESFTFLFIPLASRMFARDDREGISDLYWQTATWITVLSFPVFLLTFALAQPLTVELLGSKYAESGTALAILAVGYFVNVAFGFNAYVLRVQGRIRSLLVSDIAATVLGLGLSLVLIPRHGALGAAIGTAAAFGLHNLFTQCALLVANTGVRVLDRRFVQVHLVAAALTGGLLAFQRLASPPIYIGLAAAVAASLVMARFARRIVRLDEVFPELFRIRLVRRLLS